MCGITGLWLQGRKPESIDAMRDSLAHRGPDSHGEWRDEAHGVALGHRRLAILDLSDAGAQPMTSRSGRFVIVYNGEIYNFRELASELRARGREFDGRSDTEVVLAAIEAYGLDRALERFVGMFAFALWDRERAELSLVRDRLGIKPLYVAQLDDGLAFASELGALEQAPGFRDAIDRESLALYFRYACLPDGRSIFQSTRQVPPGTVWVFASATDEPRPRSFWNAVEVARAGLASPLDVDAVGAADRVESVLGQAVRDRLVADVPLGVFLSGGIDSSIVTALMCEATNDVRTFSIGFEEASHDEASDAARVAAHLGTRHTQLILTSDQAMRRVRELGEIYTEPFADSSQLPTLLVSELAREHVTVTLSGDGGDELFGGYNRHLWAPRVWRAHGLTPRPLRKAAIRAMRAVPARRWDALSALARLPLRTPGEKVHKLAGLLHAGSPDELYVRLTSIWQDPAELVLGAESTVRRLPALPGADMAHEMMLRDLVGYLPDDILTKVDRASMAVSLEARVPLLDHRVVELAWRLPTDVKIHGGKGKRVLRDVLARRVPRALFERPKMGFGVPLADWLRGPLRGWAEELLDPVMIRDQGLLNPAAVADRWRRHLQGQGSVQHQLWAVLMFQAWLAGRSTRRAAA